MTEESVIRNSRKWKLKKLMPGLFWVLTAGLVVPLPAATITFSGTELLGRPTDTSVTINVVPQANANIYYEYGTVSGVYGQRTSTNLATASEPYEIVISGLQPNTRYYYRMRYEATSDLGNWTIRPERAFRTQRAAGETFVFTIISDSHLNNSLGNNTTLYNQTTLNVATDNPDFHLDLGDTFFLDSASTGGAATTDALAAQRYLSQRPYMGNFSHSAAVFLSPGNHEQEEGWNFDDTPISEAILGLRARKKYWPNPIPDGVFYSGNTDLLQNPPTIGNDQFREDYYAFEWGDALFVVFDPFQYTSNNPYGNSAGEGSDDPATGDRWNWTLGLQQFNWLKQTLENSNAKYKFMFSHHMVGGTDNYVRGGAVPAHQFEWGGYNADGTTWGFGTKRPGWGDNPIHQLMISNGVSAFFHGHDHQFVCEKRDGIVYQLVPTPSMSGTGFNLYTSSPYVQPGGNLPNAGHLRVTVSPTEAKVEYVRSVTGGGSNPTNREISYTYTIAPNAIVQPDHTITATAGANGSISPSGTVGVIAGANKSFSITPNGGYQVANVLVDSASVGAVSSYTFTNVQASHTISATFEAAAATSVTLDGAVSTNKRTNTVSNAITVTNTTGTGADRLMLVGVAWNSATTARSITSVTFTPNGGSALGLTEVRTQQPGPTAYRYAAIYSLLNPPSGQTGTVTVTFSGSVSNGIIVGVANFAGVDQTTPLGTSNGVGTTNSTPSVTLTGLNGNELVFDTAFIGGNPAPGLTAGAGQTQQWNDNVSNARGAASTEQATGESVTMSWSAGTNTGPWAIAAVPISL